MNKHIFAKALGLVSVLLAAGGTARSETISVVADIAPVQGLVARVMAGVATPAVLIPPGASAHDYALRPSDARALASADVVIWMGPALTPWLDRSLDAAAGDAERLNLLDLPGTQILTLREGSAFGVHDHGHGHGDDHDDDHDDEHDDEHGDEHADEHADEHGDEHGDEHADEHGDEERHDADADPHAWLDPENAKIWLGDIAEFLALKDAQNAEIYRENAKAGRVEIDAAFADAQAALGPVKDKGFLAYHDAYNYLEDAFGLTAKGAISDSEAQDPGPARMAVLRDLIATGDIGCLVVEPGAREARIATVFEGREVRLAQVDPLGSEVMPGAGFYPEFLRRAGAELARCLAGGT